MKKSTSPGGAKAQGEARTEVDPEVQRKMFYYMLLTRELEDRIERKLYRQGKIVGGVYVGRGQEAIGVGSCIQTRPDDVICPSHRDMGAFLIRGMTPRRILAQYMGRREGYTRGKDGNMHMGDLNLNVIAFVSMLADNVPVAAGIGLAFTMRREDRVVLCYFGDGATSRGDWHEGINLAAVQKLPLVLVCNNNCYAYSTPLGQQMAVRNVAERAAAYAMPGETIDGNDVLAVWQVAQLAVERARRGEGATLIEARTYRLHGHVEGEAAFLRESYRAESEVEARRSGDPIPLFRAHLLAAEIGQESALAAIESEVTASVEEAADRSAEDPWPVPSDLDRLGLGSA